jgi:hypothetical protein
MPLLNQPIQVYGQLDQLFGALRQGQAPSKFNREFLKDLGFKSSNYHAVIPLLKGLRFLSEDGTPTSRYMAFLDETKWREILGEAIREAYADIFVMKAKPTQADKKLIQGKYKSSFNLSDKTAERAASTFLALLRIAGDAVFETKSAFAQHEAIVDELKKITPEAEKKEPAIERPPGSSATLGLHYNVQIHLPATKDVEVYNSIFKALRSHLID